MKIIERKRSRFSLVLGLVLSLVVWQTVVAQKLHTPYPIIFVHGINSNNETWSQNGDFNDILDYLNGAGLTSGGNLNVTLDYNRSTASLNNTKEEDVHLFTTNPAFGDYYTINFDVHASGIVPHEIPDWGYIKENLVTDIFISTDATEFGVTIPSKFFIGDIIRIDKEFMQVTGINETSINVVRHILDSPLSTHILSDAVWNLSTQSNQAAITKQGYGLKLAIDAIKKRNPNIKKVILVGHSMGGLAIREYIRSYYNNDVAKIVTIGTPHYGTDETLVPGWPMGLLGLDHKSDAVRDLSNSFQIGYRNSGVYLFGGDENIIKNSEYYSADVNCNGNNTDYVYGINDFNKYPFPDEISRTWIVSSLNGLPNDGVVPTSSQYIYSGDTIMTKGFHTSETTDYYSLLRGLDEPSETSMAYKIGENSTNAGFITYGTTNNPVDIDLFKVVLNKDGKLRVNLVGNDKTGITLFRIMDEDINTKVSGTNIYQPIEFDAIAGTYYIQIRGIATSVSYQYPYTLSTNFYSKLKLQYPIGSESLNAGSTVSIQWENSNLISNIKIEYSTNGGTDWNIITSSFSTTSSSYSWLVPTEISNNCKIRITDTSNPIISDENDKVFSIVDLRPNGITTTLPISITATTAISGGNIISDGGATITARGVCWNTTGNPIIDDNKTIDGTGIGSFTSNLTSLIENTTYYARTYAINNAGTAYGNVVSFTTQSVPEGMVADIDGNLYHTVTIGTQTWMVENLKTTKYRNGEEIGTTIPVIKNIYSESSPKYQWAYNGDESMAAKYGRLYTWYAATDSRNIAPAGWHVPTAIEWSTLENYLIANGYNYDGTKTFNRIAKSLATTTDWGTDFYSVGRIGYDLTKNNTSGFSALPGGYCSSGYYNSIGEWGFWWSSTEHDTGSAWFKFLCTSSTFVDRYHWEKLKGLSVRCIKDYINISVAPTLNTATPTNVTQNTVVSGGNITLDGGADITASGVCWNTTGSPTTLDSKTTDGVVPGIFTSYITGLSVNTTYYMRAYATNSAGTAYGNQVSFFTKNPETVNDIDGNVYHSIKIGTQTWMVENLKTTKYRNGDLVGTTIPATQNIGRESTPKYQWAYNGDENLAVKYGRLYTWYAATDTRNIAPTGWHVPTETEWNTLTNYLIANGYYYEGVTTYGQFAQSLAATTDWITSIGIGTIGDNITINNTSGFSALPSGGRYGTTFYELGEGCAWWSTTEYIGAYPTQISIRNLRYEADGTLYPNSQNREAGLSVRCVRDEKPSITTNVTTSISTNSSTSGGNITSDGGAIVITSGVCWSTSLSPTITDNKTSDGTGIGAFTSSITGLTPSTTYYIRAYATNYVGTEYGNEESFTTQSVPEGMVADIDGNLYNTVTIGTQTWMVENLKTTKYNDGTSIPLVSDNTWANLTTPAYCWYNNDATTYKNTYGALYNWYTVKTGKLAPTGWHVPTDAEWTTLENYLIANGYNYDGTTTSNNCGKSLAATTNWATSTGTGAIGNELSKNNSTGFSALPGGYRYGYYSSTFYHLGITGLWWSATSDSDEGAWFRDMSYYYGFVERSNGSKPNGLSVRCVRDVLTINTDYNFTGASDNLWSNSANWIGGVLPINNSNVTISAGKLATIDQNVSLTSISVAPGAKLTLNSGKTLSATTLNLKCDATGTATFVNNGGITNITGICKVEQDLTGRGSTSPNGRYWYISSPLTNATSNAFDLSEISNPLNALWSFTESNYGYYRITNASPITLLPGKGYVVLLGGNKTVSLTGSALNDGPISIQITRANDDGLGTNPKRGFNLVGNPYPSYLNINTAFKSPGTNGLETSLWYRAFNSINSKMAFDTYNAYSGEGISLGSDGPSLSNYIPPMQAFWVRATTDGVNGTLALTNEMRSHQTTGNKLRSANVSEAHKLRLQVSDGVAFDQTLICFYSDAINGFDNYDSHKLSNDNSTIPEIYTYAGSEQVAINGMSTFIDDKEIPIGFKTGKSGLFSIKAIEIMNLDDNQYVILKDKQTGISQNLKEIPEYNFSSEIVTTPDRFSIFIGKAATALQDDRQYHLNIYSTNNNQIVVNITGSLKPFMITVYNALGKELMSTTTSSTITTLNHNFGTGAFIVKVNNEDYCASRKVIINN